MMHRRDFLKTVSAGAGLLAHSATAATGPNVIEAFDYRGVKLHDSRWRRQVQDAREYYFAVSDDDILHGFRAAAGLPAPGKPLGGWCRENSSTVFGQWLSGMARLYRATGDDALRDKAAHLMSEWAKTVKPGGDCGMRHYAYDKLVCGLLDM